MDAAFAGAKRLWSALPHGDGAYSLVRDDLWMAAADFRVGAESSAALGRTAAIMRRHFREAGFQFDALCAVGAISLFGRHGSSAAFGGDADEPDDALYAGAFFEHARIVVGLDCDCDFYL